MTMTTEETIAFLEGHEDETFELAKQLANVISYDNRVEVNALRMMRLLEPIMRDKTRMDWLTEMVRWHTTPTLIHGQVREYRFRTPPTEPTINVRSAIDAARINPVGK
jgi:hypothetical protein